jgi:hypothetical protein
VAARIHVRASSSRIAFSFSVLDWVAQLIASSAYCRNWLVSDMTVLPAAAGPLTGEPAPMELWKSGQNRSLPLQRANIRNPATVRIPSVQPSRAATCSNPVLS